MSSDRTTLLLVRHGEAGNNREKRFGGHSPVPLTDLGRRQAALAGAALARSSPTAVISSDLVRARETAEAIAAACALPIAFDPALRERGLGVLDGLRFDEAEARFPDAWRRLYQRDAGAVPEGGETVDGVYARVAGALDSLVERHRGGRVVVVSHGLALFHAFSHVCGLGSPSGHARVWLLVDNASITELEHRHDEVGHRWRIVKINDTGHLQGSQVG